MSNVPVMQSVRAAIEFRRLHWREAAGALALAAVGGTLAATGDLAGNRGLDALGELIGLVGTIVAYGALLRLAFADEHPGDPEFRPGLNGLQWGRPEWRIVGMLALISFAVLVAFALATFVLVLVAVSAGLINAARGEVTPEQVMQALGPGGQALVALITLGFLAGILWTGIRISLAPAATVARRRISVFDTWKLTKGQFWRIFAATILVSLPTLMAGVLAGAVAAAAGRSGDQYLALPAALLVGLIPGLVSGFVQLPLSAGLTAYLFRGLRPPEEAMAIDTGRSKALTGAP